MISDLIVIPLEKPADFAAILTAALTSTPATILTFRVGKHVVSHFRMKLLGAVLMLLLSAGAVAAYIALFVFVDARLFFTAVRMSLPDPSYPVAASVVARVRGYCTERALHVFYEYQWFGMRTVAAWAAPFFIHGAVAARLIRKTASLRAA